VEIPHTWTFEVIERGKTRPTSTFVDVNGAAIADAWNNLRSAIDDSPLAGWDDVIAISLVARDKGAVVERPGV